MFFGDGSKFNLVGSDGSQYVKCHEGERSLPKCVKIRLDWEMVVYCYDVYSPTLVLLHSFDKTSK